MAPRPLGLLAAFAVLAACGQGTAPTGSPTHTASAPPSSPSATPEALGAVTFMRFKEDDEPEVWSACGDLGQARQLTSVPDRGSGYPVWAPDGSRIAFDSDREDPSLDQDPVVNDIFTMAADGTDVRKVTASDELATDPAYSPDGRLIAFAGGSDGDPASAGIYTINASDGSGRTRVTTVPEGISRDLAPRFSPDGSRLVFTRESNSSDNALFVVGADGSNLAQLPTTDMNAGDAAWSADGTKLVFEADSPGFPYGSVWTINADGSGLTNLLPNPSSPGATDGYSDPVYSPDGAQILLAHGLYESGNSTEGLAIVSADGTGLHYVGDGKGGEQQPDWARSGC
jgi:TolB protein